MMLLIQYTLVFSSVLLLVALGGCFSERSGIINIGLEGIMVIGALGGVMVLHNLSPQLPGIVILLLTVAASIAAGMIYSLLLAVASINFKADQTLVGTAMNMLGLALATVIAQCLSAVLTLYMLTTTDGPYRICWKKLCMDWSLLYRIVCVGLPAAIQQMVTSVSNVFVQSYINVFGSDVMAGWSACMKIDQFMMLPMMSVGLASTTFTGQNVGASYIDRAKKGATTAFLLAELVTIVMMIPLLIFAPQMVYLFNQEAAVIRYGTLFLYLLSPFYILCCVNQVYSNVLRGAGDTRTPMIVMLGSFVVFRQIYLFVMSHMFDSIVPIALGYPAGWLVCSVLIYACYRKFRWDKGMRKN